MNRALRLCIPIALFASGAFATEHFALRELATRGRTVAAEIADFDGDSKTDLLQIVVAGVPPNDTRTMRLHSDLAGGGASTDLKIPEGAAIYDVGDLDGEPGVELLLMRQRDLLVVSLANGTATSRAIAVPGLGTIAPRDEERMVARVPILHTDGDGSSFLIVQQFGQVAVLSPSGEVRGQLETDGVSSYFIFENPGLAFNENPIEINYTPDRVSVGRVDDDPRVDIVTATRHGVRVFLQRPDHSFGPKPDAVLPLQRVTAADHVRRSGGATAVARDLDGDDRADLMVTSVTGGLTDATTSATIHTNRGGTWNLDTPDQQLELSARGTLTLLDIAGDKRPELVEVTTPFSAMELVEMLLTQSVDTDIAIYRAGEAHPFDQRPWVKLDLSLPVSFETFSATGFIPYFGADLNGDGARDLVTSGDGEQIEVYLGGEKYAYDKRVARQDVGKSGEIRSGDFDGDGRVDLVLYDPRRADVPLKLLRNRGTLPGSPPVLEAGE